MEAKQRWKRQTQTTNNKIVMQDDDGDEQLSLQTMPISICTRRTLMVVPHWHIDFLQKMQKSMCECGAKVKMETTESDDKQKMSCQTMTAMKNDHDGRCESIFVHVELSF